MLISLIFCSTYNCDSDGKFLILPSIGVNVPSLLLILERQACVKLAFSVMNEFESCFELLSKCEATLSCGCRVSYEETFSAVLLLRKCKDYLEAYYSRFGNF